MGAGNAHAFGLNRFGLGGLGHANQIRMFQKYVGSEAKAERSSAAAFRPSPALHKPMSS